MIPCRQLDNLPLESLQETLTALGYSLRQKPAGINRYFDWIDYTVSPTTPNYYTYAAKTKLPVNCNDSRMEFAQVIYQRKRIIFRAPKETNPARAILKGVGQQEQLIVDAILKAETEMIISDLEDVD